MSQHKRSDRAIEAAGLKLWQQARAAHVSSVGMQRLALAFGVSLAVLLPLADPTSPSQQASLPPKVVNQIDVHPPVPDVHVKVEAHEGDTYNEYPIPVTIKQEPVRVVSVQPVVPRWHRATFRNAGDKLWAIPNEQFEIERVRAASEQGSPDPVAGCTADQCNASFAFNAPDFNAAGQSFAINGRRIAPTPAGGNCALVREDFEPFLECVFQKQAGGRVCLHMRRSTEVEEPGEGVALDVRWTNRADLIGDAANPLRCKIPKI